MRYFLGTARDLGNVTALPHASFEALCTDTLLVPVKLSITKAALFALPHKEQQAAKRVAYITPAAFSGSPSPRNTESAAICNLIALDIDGSKEARRIITQRPSSVLGELGFVCYHTARSTPEAPRIRIIVSAQSIPLSSYGAAVKTVASLLGLAEPTRESLVSVQPMYLPTMFEGETESPVIESNVFGEPFILQDVVADTDEPAPQQLDGDGPVKDISFLRTPLEGVTEADAEGALAVLDPDCPMAQWIEIGAALKHQFGEAGMALWDKWSAKGKKYDPEEMDARWRSLRANPGDRIPVTIRSVFRLAKARGWVNLTLAAKAHQATLEWLRSEARSGEQLLDEGCQRIAKIGPTIGTLERKTLIVTLKDRLVEKKLSLPLGDIKRKVKELEMDAAKTGVPPWAKGLCYITALNQFYRHTTDRRFSPEVIDLMYSVPQIGEDRPMRPRDYLIQIAQVAQVENVRYDPSRGSKKFFTSEDKPFVNIYRPSRLQPNAETAEEAGTIFQEHIANLVAEPEYQRHLIDFLAYHIQHPGQKIRHAVLLQSTPGAGKTFIAVALSAMLGAGNVRKLSASAVLDSQYNDWAYGRQIIIMEEVRVAGSNRYAVMDKLKPLISDDEISYSKKYEDNQTVPNTCNYLMFTNHHDSLAVHDDDRRYFVVASPLQRPEQVAALGGQPYFDRLFGMVKANAAGLRSWFEQWTISPNFNPDARAPMTKYLKELAEAAASPLMAAVKLAIEDEAHPLVRRDLLSIGCLRACMNQDLKHFTDQALAGVLRELGWEKAGRHTLEEQRHSLWVRGLSLDAVTAARQRLEFL